MKRLIPYLLILILLAVIILNKDAIYEKYTDYIIEIESKEIKVPENNEYSRNYSFSYVQLTDDFIPENKQDLLNILFTGLNSGKDSFDFYCSKDYDTCIEDVEAIAKDQVVISDINNFVQIEIVDMSGSPAGNEKQNLCRTAFWNVTARF